MTDAAAKPATSRVRGEAAGKVLLTGASGALGRMLAKALSAEGCSLCS